MKSLLIVGAGGHGRSVAEAVLAAGQYRLVGFVDDAAPGLRQVWEWPVFGTTVNLARYRQQADAAIVAVGNNRLREELYTRLDAAGFELATTIHPKAVVSPRAVIGAGSAIMAGAIVGTEAQLRAGVIVNCGAVVDHHCRVEDFGHLGVNAGMAGGSVLGRGAWMQAGSVLGYGVKVEAGFVLAPGQALSKK
ncbi:NeuD/PglB/VioB family sugar acetyltransferase [Polaromonas sp. C04]|uniref:NeuD/PglB/VioB family sugar acetyltransferase n=1 Tax=Polaromonas sp. C04 TaxID=1945857 RepID=UPI000985B532|nr:NeuD/PglB/VioB family sugar acetyltransferase [Polaromonas sp. C04]OOG50603.1 acetyltransferase [Polaromonas sp. C04]